MEREADAIRKIAMMAGAVVIARASNAKTAKKVLESCRANPDYATRTVEAELQ